MNLLKRDEFAISKSRRVLWATWWGVMGHH